MFMSDFTKPGSSLARIATHTRDRIGSIPIDSLRVFDNAPYPRPDLIRCVAPPTLDLTSLDAWLPLP